MSQLVTVINQVLSRKKLGPRCFLYVEFNIMVLIRLQLQKNLTKSFGGGLLDPLSPRARGGIPYGDMSVPPLCGETVFSGTPAVIVSPKGEGGPGVPRKIFKHII